MIKLIMVVYAIDEVVLGSVFCCAAVFRCRLFVVFLLPSIFLVFLIVWSKFDAKYVFCNFIQV